MKESLLTPSEKLYAKLKEQRLDFFVSVPCKLLNDLIKLIENDSEVIYTPVTREEEGIGILAGSFLAGKRPAIVMQNSGIGTAVNPLISLADSKVYQIPMILVIGWRGEPGIKDEPQHVKQGEITLSLLEAMGITYEVVDKDLNSTSEIITKLSTTAKELNAPVALVVKKGAFESYKLQNLSHDQSTFEREDAIKISAKLIEKDAVVLSTTGKISRELYEYRQSEKLDNVWKRMKRIYATYHLTCDASEAERFSRDIAFEQTVERHTTTAIYDRQLGLDKLLETYPARKLA